MRTREARVSASQCSGGMRGGRLLTRRTVNNVDVVTDGAWVDQWIDTRNTAASAAGHAPESADGADEGRHGGDLTEGLHLEDEGLWYG